LRFRWRGVVRFGFFDLQKFKGDSMYQVIKPINNNIVRALDENTKEVIVVGKGIGFKAQQGMELPPEKIEKVFGMRSQNNQDRLNELFGSLPVEYIELTDEIFEYAKQHLQKRLNEAAYFTLADHISFALQRYRQGMEFQNILLPEVRRFYQKEFEIGMYALRLMNEKLGVDMPEDEAASIAIHILNAESDISISETFSTTKLMDQIIAVIAGEVGQTMGSKDFHSERFYRHLRYLAQCIIRGEPAEEYGDDGLYDMLSSQYPEEIACAEVVAETIEKTHNYTLVKEEISRLAIHIRLVSEKEEKKGKHMIFSKRRRSSTILAPINGELIPITEVNDPSFSQGLLGKGVAIRPSSGRVVSPVNGTVVQMFKTGHAVTLLSDEGTEILIHVGIDTVNLKGAHFTAHAKEGATVTFGDLLIEFDPAAIFEAGYDLVTPIVVLNTDDYKSVEPVTGKVVSEGDEIIYLTKK